MVIQPTNDVTMFSLWNHLSSDSNLGHEGRVRKTEGHDVAEPLDLQDRGLGERQRASVRETRGPIPTHDPENLGPDSGLNVRVKHQVERCPA